MVFNRVEYLAKERQRALSEANELLWENIERSLWWPTNTNFSDNEAAKEKTKILENHWHPVFVGFFTSFTGTIQEIENELIKEILLYGEGRRISSIYKSLKTVSRLAFLDRTDPLNDDEQIALNDALLVIYVHIVGVFDAFAISVYRSKPDSVSSKEKNQDLLVRAKRKQLGLCELDELFDEHNEWFVHVKDRLRNRFVHRVPPYVTPMGLNEKEATLYKNLEEEIWTATLAGDRSKADKLREQQVALGSFFPFISFIESDEHMPILSTVLSDAMLFQTLVLEVLEVVLPKFECC